MNPKKQKKENNFPLMAKFLKGNLLFFATALLCSVLSTVCNSLTPQVISVTVDSVLGTEDYTLPAALRAFTSLDWLRANPGQTLLLAAGAIIIAALIGGLLGMVIAYITAKRDYYGKRFIEVSSVLMFAVPGTVLGIAYILAFNTGFLVLTGTATILVIVFVFRNMPVAIESGTTTLLQIDNSIEEASTILGAGSGYSFRRISLPMLRNAFFSGLVYSFVKAITAVSAIIFLVSPRWDLVTSKIYTLFDQAKYSQAAAFVTMMVIILLVFIGIFNGLINLLLAPRSRVPKGAGIHEKTEETK